MEPCCDPADHLVFFKETTQVSLENIDLLFGERALGTLPDDLNKEAMDLHPRVVKTERVEKGGHDVAGSGV